MKLLFSSDWLRRKIAADPNDDPEAGPSLSEEPESVFGEPEGGNVAVMGERNVVQMRVALGSRAAIALEGGPLGCGGDHQVS